MSSRRSTEKSVHRATVEESSQDVPPYAPPAQSTAPLAAPIDPLPQKTAAQIGEQYRAEQFAMCAQGMHERSVKYGPCGIVSAILLFPFGLFCLRASREEVCRRCGKNLRK